MEKVHFDKFFLLLNEELNNNFETKKNSKKCCSSKEKVKKYFTNEIFILLNVNHPNIIKLYEIKQILNNFYLVFELCNGGSLSKCLEKYKKNNENKPFIHEKVQHIMKQIVSGTKYLPNNKILHKGLKLDNILLNFENEEEKEI